MPGPLHGFRIVDLTSMISGPLATMILADQGADVIKVENPNGGDHTRAANNSRSANADEGVLAPALAGLRALTVVKNTEDLEPSEHDHT
jgi:crotonobetainyl-CoA:carnitine CoA-transferase CaiB-like acyl-CoA transferase